MAGIGHNRGPDLAGTSWRSHCWRQARRSLLPVFGTGWAAMRDEMKAWLRMQNLPGDAVLMVGETDHEAEMMAAGGLAGFISGQQYFGGMRHAV